MKPVMHQRGITRTKAKIELDTKMSNLNGVGGKEKGVAIQFMRENSKERDVRDSEEEGK